MLLLLSGLGVLVLSLIHILRVYYLEDATLEDYRQEQGIDPAPYLDAEQPLALVCNQEIVSYVSVSYTPLLDDAAVWLSMRAYMYR